MSATVVGFISEKGGVGKTTCCYHVAVALRRFHKKKVLILDTDYQRGGITCRLIPSMLEHFKEGKVPNKTLYSMFRTLYADSDDFPKLDIIQGTVYPLDIVPSDPRLAEVSVDKLPGGANIRDRNKKLFEHLSVIDLALKDLKDKYDYILIDTHPEISDLLKSVIFASDYCVSPVKLDLQSSVGVPTAIEAIKQVNEDREMLARTNLGVYKETKFAGAIGMMTREYGDDLIFTMKKQYVRLKKTDSIFNSYLTEGDGIRVASERSWAVYDVEGPIARKQADQFRAITREFIARCK
ncbi:ParA family protein [Bacillus sp. SN10]|uniref:ParA family protein n=1 Tax=Bacillus sp. SN10 TaxID=2056493 RepID=UPI000C323CA8|nr:ParA family protein [Bacillus sp. SN10]PKJ52332.1 ParA family protein [Bacillus sp. SN10]